MSAEEKHGIPADGGEALSHRARAFQTLAARLFGGEAAPRDAARDPRKPGVP